MLYDIESDREFHIRRIKIHYIINPVGRDELDNFFSQIAVRINDSDAFAGPYILDDHIFKDSGFSHTGLPDQIHMASSVVSFDSESPMLVAESRFRKNCNWIIFVHKWNYEL